MKPDSDARLPRSPDDPDKVRRLREDALRRLEEEERSSPAPVYGGPPPFRGGGSITRRRTLGGLILGALGVVGAGVAWLFRGRRIVPPDFALTGPQAPVYGGPPIPMPQPDGGQHAQQTLICAIQTHNGHLLSAVNGGGLGDPKSAHHGVALSTGATAAGPFETFTWVWVDRSAETFALKTYDGHFVTAVHGGGIGGPNNDHSPLHTDTTDNGPWEKFTITLLPDNLHATIQTADGRHFLSAVNGGGVGGSNQVPIRTDATTMGAGAVFQLVPVRPVERPSAPVYGGPPAKPPE